MKTRMIAIAAIVGLSTALFAGTANAAKEKFERTKPHVNVGTNGHTLGFPHEHQNPQGKVRRQ